MTPAQLDHLRRIDAHLANLLSTAEKRTPGSWEVDQSTTWDQARGIHPQIVQRNAYLTAEDAAFIAAAAGNAEAGWKATRLAIKTLLEYTGPLTPQIEREYAKEKLGEIIALFPNV